MSGARNEAVDGGVRSVVRGAVWQALDRAGLALALADLDGQCVRVTRAFAETFGGRPSDIEGRSFRTFAGADDDLALLERASQRLASGSLDQLEITLRIPHRDRSLVRTRLAAAVVRDGTGARVGTLVSLTNLGEIVAVRNKLVESEARARTLVDTLSEGVVLFDLDPAGELVPRLSNRAAHDLFSPGGATDKGPPRERRYLDVGGEALPYEQLPAVVAARTGRPVVRRVWGFILPNGKVRWIRETSLPVATATGAIGSVVSSMTDVTAEESARREIAAAHARFEALIEHGSDAIAVVERRGALQYASPAYHSQFGRSTVGAPAINLLELVHPEDRPHVESVVARLLSKPGTVVTFECRAAHVDGSWRNLETTASNRLDDPAVRGIVTNTRDITERVKAAARMRYLALHDELTDLPNRTLLLDRLDGALSRAAQTGRACAVLYADLDHFKTINDSLGHGAGDQVLQVVADRLRRAVRPGDSVARLSGDEFVVLAEAIESTETAVDLAMRIHALVTSPIELAERSVTVGCSLGIAVSDRHPADALLQQADTALYRAKAGGRGRWAVYEMTMGSMARQRLDTEDLIRSSLASQRLVTLFQPIADLVTGSVIATEALARIRRPDGGLATPGEFIAVAEDSGLILPLGARVMDQACAQQRAWNDDGWVMPGRVSVNLSAHQLSSPSLTKEVEDVLERHHLEPSQLCLELTETALIDAGTASRHNIAALKRTGVTFAIDDFGTGWSSLAYVRRFRVDTLKVDRSLVVALDRDPDATAVVRAVIGLGRSLGLRTIAEGVATAEQAAVLRDLGCDAAQGDFFGPPELPERLAELWRTSSGDGPASPAPAARPADPLRLGIDPANVVPGR